MKSQLIDRGKIPPQAVDIEETILGAMLVDRKGVDGCLAVIKNPEVFYKNSHRLVFEAMVELDKKNEPIDMLTVSQQLKLSGNLEQVGGDFFLIQLTQKVASSAHIEYHSRIILQKYIGRKMIAMGNRAIELGYDEKTDIFDALDLLSMEFDKVNEIFQKGGASMDWKTAVDEVPGRVERLTNNKGELTGVDTGLDNVNRHFNGWQPTDLIIIGADSGMGKTALAMTHILAAAKQGNPVGMVSMEMSTVQLAIRAVSVESQFHMRQLTQSGFEKLDYFEKLSKVVHELRELPVYIDDQPSLTIPEMKRRARFMKRKYGIKLFIADFIQMFSGDEDDVKLTGMAARELKNLAKELGIPVIALSQLNRDVKKAKYHIPSKHNLKNSSGIEEAADVITLLYRPGYYKFSAEQNPDLWRDLGLQGDENSVLIVAKNRNGGLGHIGLKYIEDKTKYVNANDTVYVDEENNVVNVNDNGIAF